MKLDFIGLGKLTVSSANMRGGRKCPDITDILPSVRARGVLMPILVRANGAGDGFEIVAGRRRFEAARIVAAEAGNDAEPLPCAILDDVDDAAAIEASLIENIARLDPDEVTRWETFTRLVREGRTVSDISTTFGLPELTVRRILALGNLLPRIRDLYTRAKVDAATVRHLTMASKSQQKAWLALHDDPEAHVPIGHQLKAWLFGGQSISTAHALFDLESYQGQIVADLFGDSGYFADADAFWIVQNMAIAARKASYLKAGWADVLIVPPGQSFQIWEHEKAAKRKSGRVYVEVRATGEIRFHEGYVTRAEARRAECGEAGAGQVKPARPEITGTMQTYVDLHRHAAVRARLLDHPAVALRLMVAHVIAGSSLWTIRPEPQSTRHDKVRESVESSMAEADFDRQRRAVLALIGFSTEEPLVVGGNAEDDGLVAIFLRLLELPEAALTNVIGIVMGETLASGSMAVAALGFHVDVDMGRYWRADDAFFDLIRDREILGLIVAEVAGDHVAVANSGEKAATLKRIIRDHLDGENGRARVGNWVPRWMAFPPASYSSRGGIGTVDAYSAVMDLLETSDDPDPATPAGAAVLPEPEVEPEQSHMVVAA